MEGDQAVAPAAGDGEGSLVRRILAGDRSAEEELVRTYRRGVVVIASVRTRDREAARDLAQDILMAVIQALRAGHLREANKLSAFIQGTARNLINNYLRSRARKSESDLDSAEEQSTNPIEELEAAERRRLLRQELQTLGMVDQQILLLSLVDGHSLAEVALRLNLSHDAVRARKSRLVRKITKKFGHVSQK
ncbi:MAG TPA: sigma-70 family RNA polymerase sigma factor [Terriglobales bacterium]|jgi:RNA polymerase sigma-70 factor (ECF subfamily)